MRESEWLVCSNPQLMLTSLQDPRYAQRLWMFACSCLHRGLFCVVDKRIRNAVFAFEALAHSDALRNETRQKTESTYKPLAVLNAARNERIFSRPSYAWDLPQTVIAEALIHVMQVIIRGGNVVNIAAHVANRMHTAVSHALWVINHPSGKGHSLREREKEALWEQADALRCIAGPIRDFVPKPQWQTPLVADLATAAYENNNERHCMEPARLLVLSDALEELGCDEPVLRHLRGQDAGDGSHYRECFYLSHFRQREEA